MNNAFTDSPDSRTDAVNEAQSFNGLAVLEAASDPILVTAQDGNTVAFANQALRRLLGLDQAGCQGRSVQSLVEDWSAGRHGTPPPPVPWERNERLSPFVVHKEDGSLLHVRGQWLAVTPTASGTEAPRAGQRALVLKPPRFATFRLGHLLEPLPTEQEARLLDLITQNLGQEMGIAYVVISEHRGSDQGKIQSFWYRDRHVPGFIHDFRSNPCQGLLGGSVAFHTDGLQDRFPNNPYFKSMGAESYLAVPLTDTHSRVIGHLAVIDIWPMRRDPDLERALVMLAARAGRHLEQTRTKERLEQTTELLQGISENLPGMLYQCVRQPGERRLEMTYASPRIESLLGLSLDQPRDVFSDIESMILPEDQAGVWEAIQRSEREMSRFDYVCRFRIDGEVRHMHWNSMPRRRPDGMVEWSGYMTDVSQLQRTQSELHALKDRHREAQIAAGIGSWDLNVSSGEIAWSEGQYELYGIAPEQGPPDLDALFNMAAPDDVTRQREIVEQSIATGEPFDYEWLVNRPDGQQRHINCRGKPIRDHEGQVTWITGMDLDITERKEAELALRRSEEKLRQAQKMEAIGQLAGGVAHDFNNLLTAILGFTQMVLARMPLGSANRADLREVVAAAERAKDLTTKLVTIGRKQIVRPEPVAPSTVIVSLEPLLRRTLGEDIVLSLDLAAAEGSIMADVSSLEQVILNLAVNARDAMPDGGQLQIRTLILPADSSQGRTGAAWDLDEVVEILRLTVTDTGCGMSPELTERVFEPFYTTKPEGKGTGLGLATVYGIVDRLGGQISVESQVGIGTAFHLDFPHYCESPRTTEINLKQLHPGGTETILVVEDDASVRRLTVRSLAALGYRVLEADGAAQALEIFQSEPAIDLLFTDVVMPQVSGTELVRQAVSLRPELRFLFTTGFTRDRAIVQSLEGHAEGVLLKPFTLEQLAQRIRCALESPPLPVPRASPGSEVTHS